jgi:hypothetical protein
VPDRRGETTSTDNGLRAGPHDRPPAAAARPPPVVDERPAGFGVSPGVWPTANEPLLSGIRDLDSNADSTAAAGTSGRTLCASIRAHASEIVRWWNPSARWYACDVPREVLLPQGPPGRLAESLPGTSISCLDVLELSSIRPCRPISPQTGYRSASHRTFGRKTTLPRRERREKAKDTEKDTIRISPDHQRNGQENTEGNLTAGRKPKLGKYTQVREVATAKHTLTDTSLRVPNALLPRVSDTLAPAHNQNSAQ